MISATNDTSGAAASAPEAGEDSAAPSAALRVRLFAALRERAGWSDRQLSLTAEPEALSPAAIWERLELGPWPPGMRVAVNQAFADRHQPLEAGDELAFLPPISGG